jgi:hypothetical protein
MHSYYQFSNTSGHWRHHLLHGSVSLSGIRLTLPLSGRQEAIGIEPESQVACPLQGLVRRCRVSTGIVYGPMPHLQSSGHLRIISHTRAQLQAKGRDYLQDGVKARTALSR